MSFQAETVTAVRIAEDAEYEGVRVRVQGSLGKARVSLQVDIGFGDVIVPGHGEARHPEQPDEGFLRRLVAVPPVRLQSRRQDHKYTQLVFEFI